MGNGEFAPEILRECVRRHVPAAEITLQRINTGKFNTSYFVCADGEGYVLRIAPPRDSVFVFYERDMMRQEPGIHALLLERTSVPVAPIVAFDQSYSLIDRDYLLMRRLPGQALSDAGTVDTDGVLREVGACLAQVHSLRAETYGYIGEHRPMEPQAAWGNAFAVMWRNLIEDVASVGHYTDDERDRMVRLLDSKLHMFERPVPSCLLHMDVWSQNILVDEKGNLTGLVDWDRALWGDPEIEFAVLDYCGISRPSFWEGYGAERDESHEARVRNVFYLLYEIQKYIVIRHGRSRDPASARSYKQQTMQIVRQAFG